MEISRGGGFLGEAQKILSPPHLDYELLQIQVIYGLRDFFKGEHSFRLPSRGGGGVPPQFSSHKPPLVQYLGWAKVSQLYQL